MTLIKFADAQVPLSVWLFCAQIIANVNSIRANINMQQSAVCALSVPWTRSMSKCFATGMYVGCNHMHCHYDDPVARVAELYMMAIFCQCLAKDIRHQTDPFLGHAIRIGEAKNPGPRQSTCLVNVVLANPTSLANKKDTVRQLIQTEDVNVLCLAETSATREVQMQCQKDLARQGFKTCWSHPVPPQRTCQNGADSIRGRTGGTAVTANIPLRPCRNPMPPDWKSTTRYVHTIASWGQTHVQIFAIYSIPQSHNNAKDFLNNLLTMTLQQASNVPLPFIICGDFNMELHDLPIWEIFQRKGCADLIAIHHQKYGTTMPPTCQGVTRPDNAIISRQLLPYVGHVKVLSPEWFATHCPVFFSLQLPQPTLHKVTLKMPQSWIELGIDNDDMLHAYETMTNTPVATTLEEWGQKVESLADVSLKQTYAKDGHGHRGLPKAYRGRCQPRHPVKSPIYSSVKKARQGDFEPLFEINRMSTKRQIKQTRRIQNLLRRIQKLEQDINMPQQYHEECHQEWVTILQSTAFGAPFHEWLTEVPELGYPQWLIPTSHWLSAVSQYVQHQVTAAVAEDHAIFAKKNQFNKFCDQRYQGSAQAFSKIKGAPPAPITEVYIPAEAECVLVWKPDANQVECFCEDPELFNRLSPVTIMQHTGWIVQQEAHSFTVQFHSLPDTEETVATVAQAHYVVEPSQVADQLTAFWAPLWQATHEVQSHDCWPEFDTLLQQLPVFPASFQFDDSLEKWKEAIKKLRATSARGFDGVSAQEIKTLPDGMIQELIMICNSYTQGFPTWFMRTRVCPLNKVADVPMAQQSRPICIMSQIYRLFAGVFCTQVLQHWSCMFPPSITGMLPARGSYDAAYAVQMMIELAKFRGHNISGLTLDLKKCFNCIRHEAGHRLLTALGLPKKRILQFMLSIKRMHRYWEVSGQSFGPVSATCGFPEGDAHSVLIMLAIALLWACNVNHVTSANFQAAAYADNWSWITSQACDHGPAAQATGDVTSCCGLSIDWGKTWRWATSTSTAEQALDSIQATLHTHDIDRCHNAKDLGFQLHYSGVRTLGSRKTRLEHGQHRLSRLAQSSYNLTVKEHVLRMSIYPAMFYGTEIFPVASDTLSKIRSSAAEALVGPSHSMSPALILLLTKGTILDPEFIVMSQAVRSAMQWLAKQSPQTQQDFFKVASQFVGSTMNTAGPASTLKHYLTKMSWTIDAQGFLLIEGLIKCHLVRDGFPTVLRFMTLTWQQQLVTSLTSRFSLFSMPDISRCDTLAILKTCTDADRRQIMREIAGAYQTESQKAHWVDDNTGNCQFCGAIDDKCHRLLQCPVFAHTREPFQDMIRQADEEGLTFAELAVIHSHADMQVHQLLHHQQPDPIVAENFHTFAQIRQLHNQPFNIYVDGSCSNPSFPTTRYAAFAVVLDTADNDFHRRDLARAYRDYGVVPHTLQTCFAARVRGFQSIPRAELSALKTAATIPFGIIHSDSNYAIKQACAAVTNTTKLYAKSNADVLWEIHDLQPGVSRFKKIKAHQNLHAVEDLLDLYHALGNHVADETAKHACKTMNQEWQIELQKFHDQTNTARNLLSECYQLHLELFKARARTAQQMTRQDAAAVPVTAKNSPDTIFHKLCNWMPNDTQVLTFPGGQQDWFSNFSWGTTWAQRIYEWMQQIHWPNEPQGPLEKEIGISWLELALSLTFTFSKCLPILRKTEQGQVRLLMVEDAADVEAFAVHLSDIAATAQKMWTQAMLLVPESAVPANGRGLQTSLYVQGFGQSVSGLCPRPNFPMQESVLLFVRDNLQGRKSYDQPFRPTWLETRVQHMQDLDWMKICDTFKYSRRNIKQGKGNIS